MQDIARIMELLPHRYPFLLVDRVLSVEPGKRLTALKNVSVNEEFFNGHFPGFPVMPGVLIVEALAQAGGLLAMQEIEEPLAGRKVYFMGIDKARFRRPVVPGDQLRLEVEVIQRRNTVWRLSCKAFVEEHLAAEADLKAMIAES